MTDAPLPREEALRLLTLCEAATPAHWRQGMPGESPYGEAMVVTRADDTLVAETYHDEHAADDAAFIAVARTEFPRVLHEVLRLQEEVAKAREYAETMGIRHQRLREVELAPTQAELAAWRKLQPELDRLAELLGTCEGVSPVGAAVAEIERLRADDDFDFDYEPVPPKTTRRIVMVSVEKYDEACEEIARLRRALDAAGIVRGSET